MSLDTNRVGHFKLEETAGLVCRNQVRTLVADNPTLTGAGGTSSDGTAADDWEQLTNGAGIGSSTATATATGTTQRLSILNGGTGAAQNVMRMPAGFVIGERYTIKVRWRLLEEVVGLPQLLSFVGGTSQVLAALNNFTVADGWQTTVADLGAATLTTADVCYIRTVTSGHYASIEIDSIEVYAENAATPSENMSGLTAPGVSGRGVLMDGTQHILAPYAAGFGSYPFSMGCAFKHDGTAAERTLIAIADADAGSIFWRAKLRSSHELGVNRRNGSTEYLSNLSGALDTNWHTVLAVFPDATSAIAYVDGVEAYNQTGLDSVAAAAAAVDMMIGDFRTTDSVQQMIGNLDEASFWTRALSAAEAAEYHEFAIFPFAARHSAEPLGLETSLSL